MFIFPDFVPKEHASLLEQVLQPAPFFHDPLAEISGNGRKIVRSGPKDVPLPQRIRRGTPDSLDDILGSDGGDGLEDDFVIDDDGAGYALDANGHLKRTSGHLDDIDLRDPKRRVPYEAWEPSIHESFQPGSTPWRGNRRYLCEKCIFELRSVMLTLWRSQFDRICVDCGPGHT